MKSLSKLFLAVSLMVLGSAAAGADNGNQSGGDGNFQPIVLKPGQPIGHRHKAPSMQEVNAVYSDGSLTFEFAIPEGQCQLVLSDPTTGETVAAGFDSAVTEPVYVGYHATASLTVTTANGNTYTGMW